MNQHQLLIGTYGWQHRVWEQEFYPEDLPSEWQLGYYGNEFQLVMIPADYWSSDNEIAKQWLEETDQSPDFICEWPDDPTRQKAMQHGMMVLGERVEGVVIGLSALPGEQEIATYTELANRNPVIFELAGMAKAHRSSVVEILTDKFGKEGFSLCWHGDEANQHYLEYGRVGLTRISTVSDHRQLRYLIEANMRAGEKTRTMMLIIDGDPPDIQLVQNAGIILDLL